MNPLLIDLTDPPLIFLPQGKVSGARIFRLIERKPLIDIEEGLEPEQETVVGEIQLKGVSFAYPARPDVAIFSDFNLVVPAGKGIARLGQVIPFLVWGVTGDINLLPYISSSTSHPTH